MSIRVPVESFAQRDAEAKMGSRRPGGFRELRLQCGNFIGKGGWFAAFQRARWGRSLQKGLEVAQGGIAISDDARFINEEGDGHHLYTEVVERISEDGPVHLLPLHVEEGPRRVLFLNDSGDFKFA